MLLVIGTLLVHQYETTYATLEEVTFDRNIGVSITYPDSVVAGKTFTISFIVSNTANSEKQDITISIDGQAAFKPLSENRFHIPRLAGSGTYGTTLDFQALPNATLGIQYLNVNFTRVSDPDIFDATGDIFYNMILPVQITEKPRLVIRTVTPDSIFANAEFPFEVEIEGLGTSLSNVNVQIIPPKEINFRGETLHTFSFIDSYTPIGMQSQLVTMELDEVGAEHYLPFQITVNYMDDAGEQKTESKTVSLLLRPRGFMELTTEGGIWIGNIFVAPYVSIGTIVGIPAGALITILVRRNRAQKTSNGK